MATVATWTGCLPTRTQEGIGHGAHPGRADRSASSNLTPSRRSLAGSRSVRLSHAAPRFSMASTRRPRRPQSRASTDLRVRRSRALPKTIIDSSLAVSEIGDEYLWAHHWRWRIYEMNTYRIIILVAGSMRLRLVDSSLAVPDIRYEYHGALCANAHARYHVPAMNSRVPRSHGAWRGALYYVSAVRVTRKLRFA